MHTYTYTSEKEIYTDCITTVFKVNLLAIYSVKCFWQSVISWSFGALFFLDFIYIFQVIKTFFIYIAVLNDLYLLHFLCVLNVFKGVVKRYNLLFYALSTKIVSCEHKSRMSKVKSKHHFKIGWSHISIRQSDENRIVRTVTKILIVSNSNGNSNCVND